MKVLMLGRIGLMGVGGGDKVQIENTAKELRSLGIEVDIKTNLSFDPSLYDLIHIFQLYWTPETYFYSKKAKRAGKPLVLSPIHHSVEEVRQYDDAYAFGFRRLSKILFKKQHSRDTFKNVYRLFSSPQKVATTIGSVFIGLEKMHREALKMSDKVLVQTEKEAKDLRRTYGVDFGWEKVPNGVSPHFFDTSGFENPLGFEDYVICIGRIEPRKNQLSIIEAVKIFRERTNQDVQLVFVGLKSNKSHFEYLYRFGRKVKKYPWIHHIDKVPYEKMPAYYKFAKVCISASWFETTGLTSLEALYCGTNAVASGERAKEYLGKYASYCRPDDVTSVVRALEKEYFAPRPRINSSMLEEYTWQTAAQKTLEVYNSLL